MTKEKRHITLPPNQDKEKDRIYYKGIIAKA
jgi:hypothetical protein